MTQLIMAALTVATGLMAAWVGVVAAKQGVRTAHRAYHRTAALSTAASEGWSTWFLGGFSSVSMGIRWLFAVTAWMAWTLAGAGLIGLGIRFFGRG